jgi:hypothetical protein
VARVLGRRYFAASTEEYSRRNYANNASEYNTVVGAVTAQRRSLFFYVNIFCWEQKASIVILYDSLCVRAPHLCVFVLVCVCDRHFLLRDVYDDMMLDGVQPTRDVFHSLIVGTMKGARLEDGFYFRDQMKVMGLIPDVCFFVLYDGSCGLYE